MYTCFAPYDPAFEKMNDADREALFKDKSKLAKFVHNHVLTMGYALKDLTDGMKLKTMDNQEVTVSKSGDNISLHLPNGKVVMITKGDFKATNGYVHMIDNVML